MYSELEEQEANNIKMCVSAPDNGDCVRVIKHKIYFVRNSLKITKQSTETMKQD